MIKLLLICLFPVTVFCQRNWNINIEGQISYFNVYETWGGIPVGIGIGVHYKSLELNAGLQMSGQIYWPSITLKHHFSAFRQSRGFVSFNYQQRKYILHPGTSPWDHRTSDIDCYGCEVRAKSSNFHFGLGLEPAIWDRIAFPLTLAIGAVHHKGTTINAPDIAYGPFNKWEFSPYLSIGMRIYLLKRL